AQIGWIRSCLLHKCKAGSSSNFYQLPAIPSKKIFLIVLEMLLFLFGGAISEQTFQYGGPTPSCP
ncbi:hypothetical protein GGF41_004912, partial [Coemansia sp. RSA 2531]